MEYSNSQIRKAIEEYIHSSRDRVILRMRFIDGLTLERIAEEMQMSPRQIGTITRKGEAILRKHL